jgi:hypothetical protein
MEHMKAALYHRRTENGCLESLQKAVRRAHRLELQKNRHYLPPWKRQASKRVTQTFKGQLEGFIEYNEDEDSEEEAQYNRTPPPPSSRPKPSSQAPPTKLPKPSAKPRGKGKERDMVKYLINEWVVKRQLWAAYPRSQHPLLLQITSTNPVEAWHNALRKKSLTQAFALLSLAGCIETIDAVASEYEARALRKEDDFYGRQLSEAQRYPRLATFPLPLQKRTRTELRIARAFKKDGASSRREFDNPAECECSFYRKYLIPCRHIWYRHITHHTISDEQWDTWQQQFKENGMEVYEVRTKIVVDLPPPSVPVFTARETYTLQYREISERLRTAWYDFMDETEGLPEVDRIKCMKNWLNSLNQGVNELYRKAARDFLQDIGAGKFQASQVLHGKPGDEDDETAADEGFRDEILATPPLATMNDPYYSEEDEEDIILHESDAESIVVVDDGFTDSDDDGDGWEFTGSRGTAQDAYFVDSDDDINDVY